MAITTAVCTSFREEVIDGTHDFTSDTFKLALIVNSPAGTYGAATTNYSDMSADEVASGNGYTTGGATLSGVQQVTDGTAVIIDWTTDPSWTTASFTARGCLIYNASKSDKAVAVYDFGADITSTNGTFLIVFPAATAAAGLVRLS